jgi:class 3 adenylate cyclase
MQGHRVAVVLFIVALQLAACLPAHAQLVKAAKAYLTDNWALGGVKLAGDWAFFPEQFLDPARPLPAVTRFLRLPGTLQDPTIHWGTLAVTLSGLHSGRWWIRLPTPYSADEVFWNGERVAGVGTPAPAEAQARSRIGDRALPLSVQGEDSGTLLIHLSNFEMPSLGIAGEILMGDRETVLGVQERAEGTSYVLFTILAFFAAYHLAMFFCRPKETAPLFLGICAVLLGVRSLFDGAYLGANWIPEMPLAVALKIIYFSLLATQSSWLVFVRALFPEVFRSKVWISVGIAFAAVSVAILLLPLYATYAIMPGVMAGAVVITSATIAQLGRATLRGGDNAALAFCGSLVPLVCLVNDILNDQKVLSTGYFLPWGMVAFLSFQALAVIRRFAISFKRIENLSVRLNRSFEESQRRLKITEVYTRPSLVEAIRRGDDPTTFAPVARNVTVLFSDICEYTKMAENLGAIETVQFLNKYFQVMSTCVSEAGGEIDKLIGDCIMALFESPDTALQTAILMRRRLADMNLDNLTPQRLNNGIGINHGEVVLGNIGSVQKMDYTVIGDIVNTASRIESLTRHYGAPIIISDELMVLLEGRYQVRFIDQVQLKGKRLSTKIYEVFDFEREEIIEFKLDHQQVFESAFKLYERADFAGAMTIYADLIRVSPNTSHLA